MNMAEPITITLFFYYFSGGGDSCDASMNHKVKCTVANNFSSN